MTPRAHVRLVRPAKAYLHGFRPVLPGASMAQRDGLAWLGRALERASGGGGAEVRRALKLYERLGRSCRVDARVSALADYRQDDWSRMELFRPGPGTPWHQPPLEARMAVYERAALRLAEEAFPPGEAPPDIAVQVSCTGYSSPHAVQRVAARRGWACRLLHLGHMGCYAAVPAVDMAARLVRAEAADGRPQARAGLFFVELCTLHLKPGSCDDGQVVVNTLFADGALRLDVSAAPRPGSLALLASAEEVLPGSEDDMTWRLGDSAFAMGLSRQVPELLGDAVRDFALRFLARADCGLDEVSRFAVHPGGPRIIDRVLSALGRPAAAASHSAELLRLRGNMSSCTLPHVWDALLKDPGVREGELILSLAFGPGLTLVADLLQKRG